MNDQDARKWRKPQCNYGYIQQWTTKYLQHKETEIPITNVYSTM